MLARLTTFAIDGLASRRITVEVDLRTGLPGFTIVGRGDAAVRESRERVHSARAQLRLRVPEPARHGQPRARVPPEVGARLRPRDARAACSSPAARCRRSASTAGRSSASSSLGGELRPCGGALAVAEGARRHGLDGLIVPRECAAEAGLVEGVAVAGVGDLAGVAAILRGDPPPELPPAPSVDARQADDVEDLRDVRGHARPSAR